MADEIPGIDTNRSHWAECERQLYPLAVSDAPRYQRIVLAVRALSDNLQAITTTEQLLKHWPGAESLLASVMANQAISANGLPLAQIAGAAFALRDREISELQKRELRIERIEAALTGGETWVLLDEAGDIDSGLLDPYRSTEMHLDSGLTLMTLVQADPADGSPRYVIAVILLDPASGELLDTSPGVEDWVEFPEVSEFIKHRASVRADISQRVSTGNRD